jgi:hypothetical protein
MQSLPLIMFGKSLREIAKNDEVEQQLNEESFDIVGFARSPA